MSSVAVSPAANAAVRTVVHKFGGTSVADAERYRHVAQLLLARDETVQVTVVSAMKGVTDALIGLAKAAAAADPGWDDRWHELRARHRGAAAALLGEQSGVTIEWLDARFERLREILAALAVIGELPQEVLDRVQGAQHFDLSSSEAYGLYQQMLARLPGYLVPKLVREEAGQPHKTPLHAF